MGERQISALIINPIDAGYWKIGVLVDVYGLTFIMVFVCIAQDLIITLNVIARQPLIIAKANCS